jgi:serine/threonine protein kinase
MELCSGGDLYSRDPYTEEEAARIISSILSAVSYMHQQGIVHRYVSTLHVLPRVLHSTFRMPDLFLVTVVI